MKDKITSAHLARPAFVYVRQSTQFQVRNNLESQRRQYALAGRAKELGWRDVEVVDEDMGCSGSGSVERKGFERLVAAVSLGKVGAVLSLEASRLARNNRDWHQLVDLCALSGTLIIDQDGIYEPRLLNDRLLLGLKGTGASSSWGCSGSGPGKRSRARPRAASFTRGCRWASFARQGIGARRIPT